MQASILEQPDSNKKTADYLAFVSDIKCCTNQWHPLILLQRHRKIFFSTGEKHNKNKIHVKGDQWWILNFQKEGLFFSFFFVVAVSCRFPPL